MVTSCLLITNGWLDGQHHDPEFTEIVIDLLIRKEDFLRQWLAGFFPSVLLAHVYLKEKSDELKTCFARLMTVSAHYESNHSLKTIAQDFGPLFKDLISETLKDFLFRPDRRTSALMILVAGRRELMWTDFFRDLIETAEVLGEPEVKEHLENNDNLEAIAAANKEHESFVREERLEVVDQTVRELKEKFTPAKFKLLKKRMAESVTPEGEGMRKPGDHAGQGR